MNSLALRRELNLSILRQFPRPGMLQNGATKYQLLHPHQILPQTGPSKCGTELKFTCSTAFQAVTVSSQGHPALLLVSGPRSREELPGIFGTLKLDLVSDDVVLELKEISGMVSGSSVAPRFKDRGVSLKFYLMGGTSGSSHPAQSYRKTGLLIQVTCAVGSLTPLDFTMAELKQKWSPPKNMLLVKY
ncbi:hypothetical protein NPIL_364401 [Nephila pilipes]|uniref:Uncharacterized protein n=1 Tax=Nephila pilipes TaxID=299642 RepID=A0A8X6Q8X7_NEPPI|nr:hypothetical protein NPIL_364401 [Nephila pilipes]